jgi:uncharacterized repeat protein (TIGR01451 family)
MPKAWQPFLIILVLAWLAFAAGAPLPRSLVSADSPGPHPAQSLGFKEEVCAGKEVVEVGIPEKPFLLPCDAAHFEELYLTYCTAEEYARLTGGESQPLPGVKQQLVPRPLRSDIQERRAFFSQLRIEARQQLGTDDPPAEVDFSAHFPPAMRQMTNDCGSCAMANGVSGVQARQFPLWGSPWTPEEIVSPFSFSRKSDSHDCSLTMAEPFVFWREEGAWTNDILPYGTGDCHSVSLGAEELALGYPLHSAQYQERVFADDDDYGIHTGTTDDLKRASALGKNVQLVFGPLGGSSWAHTLAMTGYSDEGVTYINTWGADWGPNGDGTGVFTWDWLLSGDPIWPPFFSSPDRIWFYFHAASDWTGECSPAYLQYDYRGVCQAGADLSVVKVGPVGPVLTGSQLTYEITVTNAGPDAAEDVEVTDDLPTGLGFVSASHGCSERQGTVTCVLGDMAVGADDDVEVTVRANATGRLTDLATVSGTVPDPNSFNNQAEETTEVIGRADLSITKHDAQDPVKAGEPITYTLSVHNDGPDDAHDVLLVDTLPHGAAFERASGPGWICWERSGRVTCGLSALAAGASAQVTVVVNAPSDGGAYVNAAEVSSDEEDPDESDNSAQETTTVIPQADLRITKGDDEDPVAPNEPFSYQLTVTNAGPSGASQVLVEDTLPHDVTFRGASGQGWRCEEALGAVRCERGWIAAGGQASLVIDVTPPADEGTLTNIASVSSETEDPAAANDTATESTTVIEQADLAVAKTDSADPVSPDERFSYVLTVSNAGPNDALDVAVEDALPDGVSLQTASGEGWTCTVVSGAVTCERPHLAAGAASAITIEVTASPDGDQLTNAATVSCATVDPDPLNNTATETTHVEAQADLAMAKADSADPVVAGQAFSYTLSVTNHGPSDATTLVVTDTLPTGVTLGGASGAGWACRPRYGMVTCERPRLASGTESAIVVDVTAPPDGGQFTNAAQVSSDIHDPHPGDNAATEPTTAIPQADLALTKLDSADPVAAGEPFSYTLTVTNLGPSVSPKLVVTDALPAGVVYRGASGAGWTCAPSEGTVTCEAPSLEPGEGSAIVLGVTAPVEGTILANSAAVSSTALDPDSSNNRCTERTATMGLLVGTTVIPDPVVAGHPLTYTLQVTNTGAVDLHATVTNILPVHVTPGGVLAWTATIPASSGVWATTVGVTAERGYTGVLTNVVQVVTAEGASGQRVTVSTVAPPRTTLLLPLLLRQQ